jgi:hypothetical protein
MLSASALSDRAESHVFLTIPSSSLCKIEKPSVRFQYERQSDRVNPLLHRTCYPARVGNGKVEWSAPQGTRFRH